MPNFNLPYRLACLYMGMTMCSLDIGDFVNVNDECCFAFEYDPDFVRY